MAFTADDVLTEVAYIGNDANHADFPEDQALRFLNEGQTILVRRRPDLLLQTDGTLSTPTTLAALTDTVELPDVWKAALAAWFLYRGFSADARDKTHREMAEKHQVDFEYLIGTV
mgnify:CR=1 FL=1